MKKLLTYINEAELKSNADLGDCEFIHIAKNGQQAYGNPDIERKVVHCYTIEGKEKEKIIGRLYLCDLIYNIISNESDKYDFHYKNNKDYSGKIHFIDEETLKEVDVIDVKNYKCENLAFKNL